MTQAQVAYSPGLAAKIRTVAMDSGVEPGKKHRELDTSKMPGMLVARGNRSSGAGAINGRSLQPYINTLSAGKGLRCIIMI